jgi:hypothetical protein
MAPVIPSRIIQTARSRALTIRQQATVANLRLLHPDFDYCFFDNADVDQFIDREFPEYRRAFDAFPRPIQRYDFFRYLAVYRLGGFYFDLDVLLARDLRPLQSKGCVFPFEGLTFSRLLRNYGMDWELGNYAFGATPGHPFLEKLIANCADAERNSERLAQLMDGVPLLSRPDYHVLNTTGPGQVSRTFAEHPDLASHVTVLFPQDVCEPSTWHHFGTFGVHLMEGSWRASAGFLRRRLANQLEARALTRCLAESRQRGPGRPQKHILPA